MLLDDIFNSFIKIITTILTGESPPKTPLVVAALAVPATIIIIVVSVSAVIVGSTDCIKEGQKEGYEDGFSVGCCVGINVGIMDGGLVVDASFMSLRKT